MSIEEFYNKKKKQQFDDIKVILKQISNQEEEVCRAYLREYSGAFLNSNSREVQTLMKDTGYYDICERYYSTHERLFKDYQEMIDKCDIL